MTSQSPTSFAEVIEGIRIELARLGEPGIGGAGLVAHGQDDPLAVALKRRAAWITTSQPVTARPGPLAGIKRFLKRVVFKLTRWQLEPFAENVRGFAATTADAVGTLAERMDGLEEAETGSHADLGARIEALASELRRDLAAATDRVARIERRGKSDPMSPEKAASAVGAASPIVRPVGPFDGFSVAPFDYFAFEAKFRGSREEIAERQADYVGVFQDVDDIVDIGCGRGELLTLLARAGKSVRGVDIDSDMVEICLAQGLEVAAGDGVAFLEGLEPASLGGVSALQVVEHLTPAQITRFIAAIRSALRPGGIVVLETINPASLSALRNYFADLTHRQPVVAETLSFLLESAGFADVQIVLRSPLPDREQLQPVPSGGGLSREAHDIVERNVGLLNALLFAPQDFAVIARA